MYESYWQLTSKPFENDMDTRLYFGSDPHEASLLKLRYLIENRKGAGLLVGRLNDRAGSGELLREVNR